MNPITVQTKAFTRELEWVARFIEKKTTIPILANVLLRKSGESLYLTGTDLELAGHTCVEADGPDFELTVPVSTLLKYLKKVDDPTLTLLPGITYLAPKQGPHVRECDGTPHEGCCEAPSVTSVRLEVEHGDDDARVKIEGMSVESYPELPTRPLRSIELSGLEKAIPRAITSITPEESRFTLNGALLLVEGDNASLISTDGHRLSVVDVLTNPPVTLAECQAIDSGEFKALIPKRALIEVQRLGDSAFFSADTKRNEKTREVEEGDHVYFTVGERTITVRRLTGSFPDFERVMPKDLRFTVSVPNAPLRKVIDRVSLFADERSHCVNVTVNGAFEVATMSYDHGTASGKVQLVSGPDLACPYRAGFDATYIQDFLKACGSDAPEFRFSKASTAVQWDVDGWKYVLMPMRADDAADPVAVGESEHVPGSEDWPEPESPSSLPTCAGCGAPTLQKSRICGSCALPAVPDAIPAPVVVCDTPATSPPAERVVRARTAKGMDPRLPAVGTVLIRDYDNRSIEARVLADGFEYEGRSYRSLTAIACEVRQKPSNGFEFFRLGRLESSAAA